MGSRGLKDDFFMGIDFDQDSLDRTITSSSLSLGNSEEISLNGDPFAWSLDDDLDRVLGIPGTNALVAHAYGVDPVLFLAKTLKENNHVSQKETTDENRMTTRELFAANPEFRKNYSKESSKKSREKKKHEREVLEEYKIELMKEQEQLQGKVLELQAEIIKLEETKFVCNDVMVVVENEILKQEVKRRRILVDDFKNMVNRITAPYSNCNAPIITPYVSLLDEFGRIKPKKIEEKSSDFGQVEFDIGVKGLEDAVNMCKEIWEDCPEPKSVPSSFDLASDLDVKVALKTTRFFSNLKKILISSKLSPSNISNHLDDEVTMRMDFVGVQCTKECLVAAIQKGVESNDADKSLFTKVRAVQAKYYGVDFLVNQMQVDLDNLSLKESSNTKQVFQKAENPVDQNHDNDMRASSKEWFPLDKDSKMMLHYIKQSFDAQTNNSSHFIDLSSEKKWSKSKLSSTIITKENLPFSLFKHCYDDANGREQDTIEANLIIDQIYVAGTTMDAGEAVAPICFSKEGKIYQTLRRHMFRGVAVHAGKVQNESNFSVCIRVQPDHHHAAFFLSERWKSLMEINSQAKSFRDLNDAEIVNIFGKKFFTIVISTVDKLLSEFVSSSSSEL